MNYFIAINWHLGENKKWNENDQRNLDKQLTAEEYIGVGLMIINKPLLFWWQSQSFYKQEIKDWKKKCLSDDCVSSWTIEADDDAVSF